MTKEFQITNFKSESEEPAVALRCEGLVKLTAKALQVDRSSAAKGLLMYAPAGLQTITPGAGEGSCEVTLTIDKETAPVLSASLIRMNAAIAPQRCFIDKEHEGKEATAWPLNFIWSETGPDGERAPGVYCAVEYSALGRELIDGKVERAFSPSFYTDADLPKKIRAGQHVTIAAGKRGSRENPARIIGVVAPDIGTLTNNPAFKSILPLWARDKKPASAAAVETPRWGSHGESGNTDQMKLTEQQLAALRARKSELEQNIPVLRAKDLSDVANKNELSQAETEYQSVDLQLKAHDMATQNESLQTALRANREKDADAAITAAIRRGAIPAKNESLRASWRNRLIEDPANIELLNGIPSAPALSGGVGQPSIILRGGAQEMRASSGSVLRQYSQHIEAGEHREAAALYAREIVGRLKEGDDLPLKAADVTDANLGTLAGTLVAQRTLDFFQLAFEGIIPMVTTDFSDQPGEFKTVTKTRVVIVPAVVDYDDTVVAGEPNGWVQNTAAQTVDVDVPLDKHRGVPVTINTNLLASTARRLFDEQAPAAGYALAKNVIDELYGKITAANFADNVALQVAEIDFGRRTFGSAGRVFNPLGVPETNRFALLNSDYHDALEQDPTLTNLAVYQQSQTDVITAGRLPKIKNFQPIEAPNLPTANNLRGFFGHKSSLVIKSRVPNDYTAFLPNGAAHGLVKTVTNSLGLTVLVVWYADHKRGSGNFRIALMFGTAKGYTKGGLLLKAP